MPLWKKLSEALSQIPSWKVVLIKRDSNRLADALAKLKPPQEILFSSTLPLHIQDIYLQELCMQNGQLRNMRTMNLAPTHMENSSQEQTTYILINRNRDNT